MNCGVKEEHTYFLNLPFYETGKVVKRPIGPDDIKIVYDLVTKIEPDYIFAAGDLTDPHGTHRSCLVAILNVFQKLEEEKSKWFKEC